MTWFFEDPAHIALFVAEARSWDGTPFGEGRAKGKGGGIDCVGFAEEPLAVAGIERFDFPRDEGDYRPHAHNDKILNYLRGLHPDPQSAILAARFAELDVDEMIPDVKWPNEVVTGLMTGDALIMRGDAGIWHMPLMLDSREFMHCAWPLGVTQGDVTSPNYRSKIRALFRARAIPLT